VPTLNETKVDQVTQLVNSYTGYLDGGPNYISSLKEYDKSLFEALGDYETVITANAIGLGAPAKPVIVNNLSAAVQALFPSGDLAGLYESTNLSPLEVARLASLVAAGVISAEEADGYITSVYGMSWVESGISFVALPQFESKLKASQEAVNQEVVEASSDTEPGEPETDDVLSIQSATGGEPVVQRTLLQTLDVPDDAEGEEVAQALRNLADQVQLELNSLASGESLALQKSSLDGRTIIPGTLPPNALNLKDFDFELQGLPRQSEAIELNLAKDQALDRWLEGPNTRGPGRVQRVESVSVPPDFRPGLGAIRYRIVDVGSTFGPLWVQPTETNINASGVENGWGSQMEVVYGAVITGIPNFLLGSRRRLLRLDYVGESVSPLGVRNASGTPSWIKNNPGTFEQVVDSVWVDASRTRFSSSYNSALQSFSSKQFLNPEFQFGTDEHPYLTSVQGFGVQILAGPTVEECFPQVAGREHPNVASFRSSPLGEAATIPPGLEHDCPAGLAAATRWDNGQTAQVFAADWGGGGYPTIGDATKVTTGVPFLLSDVQQMVSSRDTFSIVIQLLPARRITSSFVKQLLSGGASIGDEFRPGSWPEIEIEVDPLEGRTLAVDMLVV